MIAPKLDSGAALGFFWDVFKARPTTFIGLSVWWLAAAVVLQVGQMAFMGEDIAAMNAALQSASEGNMAAYFETSASYGAKFSLFMLISFAVFIPLEAAWLRLFMRGEGNPIFPFRIGGGEGAYLLTMIVMFAIFLGLAIAGIFAVVLVAIIFSIIGGQGGAIFGMFLGYAALLAIIAILGVRMSPAFALAVHRRKFAFGAAWGGTKAMFWPLLGCFVIAVIIMLVAYMVGMIAFLFMGIDMEQLASGVITQDWRSAIFPYAIFYLATLIPTCLMRGIACKAALTIEEANAAPPAPQQTVGEA